MSTNNLPHLLILEDDPANSDLFRYAFRDKYTYCISPSAEGATSCLENHSVDVILMDLSLEGDMDGLEFTEKIRAMDQFSKTPIIAITAHVMRYSEIQAIRAGCNVFIPKPVQIKKLTDLINQQLPA